MSVWVQIECEIERERGKNRDRRLAGILGLALQIQAQRLGWWLFVNRCARVQKLNVNYLHFRIQHEMTAMAAKIEAPKAHQTAV